MMNSNSGQAPQDGGLSLNFKRLAVLGGEVAVPCTRKPLERG